MSLFIGSLAITSPDIKHLAAIPRRHAGDGENIAPGIVLSGAPKETVEFAVVCHDPDAPLPWGFTHWTVYGVPADTSALDLSAPGVREGLNGIGSTGWVGPQPPPGHGIHHYYFWVYALRTSIEGAPAREDFLNRYSDAVIEQARFIGTFEK